MRKMEVERQRKDIFKALKGNIKPINQELLSDKEELRPYQVNRNCESSLLADLPCMKN